MNRTLALVNTLIFVSLMVMFQSSTAQTSKDINASQATALPNTNNPLPATEEHRPYRSGSSIINEKLHLENRLVKIDLPAMEKVIYKNIKQQVSSGKEARLILMDTDQEL